MRRLKKDHHAGKFFELRERITAGFSLLGQETKPKACQTHHDRNPILDRAALNEEAPGSWADSHLICEQCVDDGAPGSLIPGVPASVTSAMLHRSGISLLDLSCTRGFVVLVKASELSVDIEMIEKFLRMAGIFGVDPLGAPH